MTPRDFDLPLSDETFATCHALLEQIDDLLGSIEPMTNEESRSSMKVPKRAPRVAAEIFHVCSDLGVHTLGHARLEDITPWLERAQAAQELVDRIDRVRARLTSCRRESEIRGWRLALTFYEFLKRMARDDESLRARLAPVLATFARPRRTRRLQPRPQPAVSRPAGPPAH